MNKYQYNGFTIEVLNEPTYKVSSIDNNFNYLKYYFGDGAIEYPTSQHGVKIYQGDQIIDSCIIMASGGATHIHQSSSLVNNDELIICCCNTIFCLTLPDLNLKWKTEADPATCFQVFKLQDDYLVHGELQITRLNNDGIIKWQFGGADIFVSMGGDEFKLADDHILLTDFGQTKYKIDFNGELLGKIYK